jgi:hypothetical protein
MTLRTLVLAALIAAPGAAPMTGAALADEALTLTPPLYREQARTTAATRPASELVTTSAARRVVAAALPNR